MEAKTNHIEKKHTPDESVKIPIKWIISVVVLVTLFALAFFLLNSGIIKNGTEISEEEAKTNLLTFLANQAPNSNVTFISSSREGSLYKIIITIDGGEVPIFVTADGKYLVVDPIPLA